MDFGILLSNCTRSDLEGIANNWHRRLQRLLENREPGQDKKLDSLITELYYRLTTLTRIHITTDQSLHHPPYIPAPGRAFINDYELKRLYWMVPGESKVATPERYWGK
jgi:hypothetical protein